MNFEKREMNWLSLLNSKRLGDDSSSSTTDRTAFQRDFDRIIFSSSFRRLQSKTQVFPLPKIDFIHTRLTHSLETSSVGRSLGSIVGKYITEVKHKELLKYGITHETFSTIVSNACLAHDIGNPPFGHSGESSVSEYFRSERAEKFLGKLSQDEIIGLQNFEGNALGFRILTHTQPNTSSVKGGLQLTFATLGSFTKYPKKATLLPPTLGVSDKKYGFFESEKDIFDEVGGELGLLKKSGRDYSWYRHPLAFLVEAADDICYRIIDLEDGVKLNLLPFELVESLLLQIIGDDFVKVKYGSLHDNGERLNYLRAKSISKLVNECAEIFIKNEEFIIKGEFDFPLIEKLVCSNILKKIEEISVERIYNCHKVIEIDAAGFEIISGLLDVFLNAVLGPDTYKNVNNRKLIPKQFLIENIDLKTKYYDAILNITHFISGMSDTFALNTYKAINGLSLPEYL